ncbi:MAG: hypothetical protein JO116_24175 [Planctomycetaceae bacterium]|nr:hypothetical protein [Planctomycetaceae bacterium]MBV8558653.1 hypothetical protein [Planctomycetaceae bacterium]
MQGRSWMAALAMVVGSVSAPGRPARADQAPTTTKVKLELRIAGLPHGGGGCDVEIKPGHAGCQFRPMTCHVRDDGRATLVLEDVQARNADRDCAFAITIREPGQGVMTVRRGLRLSARSTSIPSLTCYVSSPSRLAKAGELKPGRR